MPDLISLPRLCVACVVCSNILIYEVKAKKILNLMVVLIGIDFCCFIPSFSLTIMAW